ncbi:uncharacterized protein LOC116255053 [Nymphaea colorata]|nr:uncharacterized protein LOC116255053 [Nymphaea colorata]
MRISRSARFLGASMCSAVRSENSISSAIEASLPFSYYSQQRRTLSIPSLLPPSSRNEIEQFLDQAFCSTSVKASFSTEAKTVTATPSEAAQELYNKMLKSVEAGTMPPNAWLRAMFASCVNREDVKLLFGILQKLRIFRLSHLRIHDNFNSQYCMQIAEACARAGAVDLGLKVLWKHNVYGITPTIGSAHYLLLHAKEHNDAKAMVKILQVMKRNSLQFQPTTADIVFSICYNVGDWDLICKFAKKFIKSGIKLHRTAYDIWMDFAAKMGKMELIWEIEELRSKSGKKHTVPTAFACVKGYLLQHQPENAAVTIHLLSQNLPDAKKPLIQIELQKLVTEWISAVKEQQNKEERKEFSARLKSDITSMMEHLLSMGLELELNMEDKPVAS